MQRRGRRAVEGAVEGLERESREDGMRDPMLASRRTELTRQYKEWDVRNPEQIHECLKYSDTVYNLVGRDWETRLVAFPISLSPLKYPQKGLVTDGVTQQKLFIPRHQH